MLLGAHIGISAGIVEAPATGRRIGCDAIQIFSKSPQMWEGPPISEEAAEGFRSAVRSQGLRATAVHQCYLINLASPKPPMLGRSRKAFLDELHRAEKLGVDALIFHPGAHMKSGVEAGIQRLGESLNWAFAKTPGFRVKALLENAAGQGTALCSNFLELRAALDLVTDRSRVGVAVDTCHLFASGVEFRTPETYASMVDRLRSELGQEEVRAFHLNDAKAPIGSHLDRHENIGKGEIGAEGFRPLLNDVRWNDVPGYLETPMDGEEYAAYIADLRSLRSLTPSESLSKTRSKDRRGKPPASSPK
jgi:deoxyribonuclease-4